MNSELKKREYAITFLDMLMKGIDPVTKQPVGKDTCSRSQIINCYSYLKEFLLSRDRNDAACSLSDSRDTDNPKTATELSVILSEAYGGKIIPAYEISNWMLKNDYLRLSKNKEGRMVRVPTERGRGIGIVSKTVNRKGGETIHLILYGNQAQELAKKYIGNIQKEVN